MDMILTGNFYIWYGAALFFKQFYLLGRAVDAAEALQFGLANRVVDPGTTRAEAIKYAHSLTKHPQLCMRKDRDMVLRWNIA